MAVDDSTLLEQAGRGDAAALRELLERYGGQVREQIGARIGPQWRTLIDADDVMQVTYLEAFLHIEQIAARDTAGFVAWMRRIAENNLRDAIKELERKKRPHPARRVAAPVGDDSYVALVEMLGITSATPSRQAATQETGHLIRSVLQQMPKDYRTVIQLYDLEGRDIADVAREMSRSPGAVHMLRARAHDRLRALLGSASDFFTDTA